MLLGFPADHAVWSDCFVASSGNPASNASYVLGIVEAYLDDGALIWKSCEAVKAVCVRPFQRYKVDISKTDHRRRIGVEEWFWAQAYQVDGLRLSFQSKSKQAAPTPESFVEQMHQKSGLKGVCSWIDRELQTTFESGRKALDKAREEANALRLKLKEENEERSYQVLATNALQQKVDELEQLALAAGADAAQVRAIKQRPLTAAASSPGLGGGQGGEVGGVSGRGEPSESGAIGEARGRLPATRGDEAGGISGAQAGAAGGGVGVEVCTGGGGGGRVGGSKIGGSNVRGVSAASNSMSQSASAHVVGQRGSFSEGASARTVGARGGGKGGGVFQEQHTGAAYSNIIQEDERAGHVPGSKGLRSIEGGKGVCSMESGKRVPSIEGGKGLRSIESSQPEGVRSMES
eukprot:3301062-Rhodomonas_salina.1